MRFKIFIEKDEGVFIVSCPKLDLYSTAGTPEEALECFAEGWKSLWNDLQKDDNFSPFYLRIKEKLKKFYKSKDKKIGSGTDETF